MATPVDPFHRRDGFLSPPPASRDSHSKRRLRALDAQKQRRVHAIEAARSTFRELDFMEDLSLAGSSDSDNDTERGEPSPSANAGSADPVPVIGKKKRQAFKPKFKAWAKNLLSYAETLDLRHSLPEGLESEWRAVVVPKGKRCLCATSSSQDGVNTILYSRVAGRTLGRFRTALPPDCLLDTIWDAELGVLWVIDLCKWRSTYFVECEAEMRAFFLSSKLAELDTQPYLPPTSEFATLSQTGSTKTLLVLPVPSVPAPLTPSTLAPLLAPLASSPRPAPQQMDVAVLAPYATPAGELALAPAEAHLALHPTGVLLYHLRAHYDSGATPLVSWVPCGDDVARGDEDKEGVARMWELVCEWEARGGPAAREAEALGGVEVGMVDGVQADGGMEQ